jgi:gliding motility-associated-like protein
VADFASPNNFAGCLSSGENNSVWYYFEFDNNTTPGEIITFVISSGNSADYDFAVFGPGASCGALGGPIRCSYAGGNGNTGLSTGSVDFSEGAGGDGFVAPITVGPGQGFYLMIDNFSGNGVSFNLTWGGDAADNLNCNPCDIEILGYTPSYQVCPGGPGVTFDIQLDGISGSTFYEWTSPNGGLAYLSNPFVLNPTVTIPQGINGSFTYNLTITDGSCTEQLSITVTADGVPPLNITGDSQFCPGESATLTVTPGNLSSYTWSNGASGSTITVTQAGTYTVTASNASGCTATAAFTVTELPAPTVDITGDLEICPGESTTLTASGGFIGYSWNIGASIPSITVFTPGLYTVTATSGSGCNAVNSVQVTEAPAPTPVIDGPLTLCLGESGVLQVVNGPYQSYTWFDGSTGSQVPISSPGNYSVTVTNAQGCTGNTSFSVAPSDPPAPQIIGDLVLCPGQPGMLEVAGSYTSYLWSNGVPAPSIAIGGPGSYSVTVTNAAGCSGSTTVFVDESIVVPPIITGPAQLCPGEGGLLEAVGSYASYTWSTGSVQPFTTISNPGLYELTVTNADGCVSTATYNVDLAPPVVPEIVGNLPFCEGQSVTLSLTEAYSSYSWSNGSTGPTTQVLNAGPVTVTVTDINGCTGTTSVTTVSTPAPVVDITGPSQVCPGNAATLNATPGYASYVWSDGTPGPVYPASDPGLYSVTATDANGCEGTANFTLDVAPPPMPVIVGETDFCAGSSTDLTVAGNYASVAWSNGQMGPTASVFEPGVVTATVTTPEGCVGTAETIVTATPPLSVTIDAPAGLCWGSTATLQATPDYPTYQWSDFSSTQSFTQISAGGLYGVTVTDASGCQGEASVVIDVFDPPVVAIDGPEAICEGNPDALTTIGGPFAAYLWNTGENTDFLPISSGGDYSLTITDFNGCTGESSISIADGEDPTPVLEGELLICDGGSTTLGTTESYAAYDWSNGSTSATADFATAGPISLTVTNESGCSATLTDTLIISQLDVPEITGVAQACPEETVELSVPADYVTYQWSTGSDSSSTAGIGPGTYTVAVADSLGCEATVEYTVDAAPVPDISDQDSAFCTGDTVLLEGPAGFESYIWQDSLPQADFTASEGGVYTLTVANSFGCLDTASYTLTENELPVVAIGGETSFCAGEERELSVQGGLEAYTWSNGEMQSSITVDSSGEYAVTVTDANGCQNSASTLVEVYELPDAGISGILSFCNGGNTLLSGQPGLSYSWSTGSNEQSLPVDQPGIYTLTVEDANGCRSTDSVTVQEVEELLPQIEGPNAFCTGESIQINGEAGYTTYAWSSGENTAAITVDEPGQYTLSVTDANGCSGSTQVDILENELPPISIDAVDGFCEGETATLSATAGYTDYEWSNAAQNAAITVEMGGTYSLTVTDASGCQNETAVSLSLYPLPAPYIQGALNFCPEDQSTLSLGESYESYAWSTGSTAAEITVNSAGTFAVSVTDNNGCSATDTISTEIWPSPEPEIAGIAEFCEGSQTELQSTQAFSAYAWSTGGQGSSEIVDEAGTVSLTVTDSNGCMATAVLDLIEHPLPQVTISGEEQFCAGDSVSLSATAGFESYAWNTQDTTESLALSTPGEYSLTVTDAQGCAGQASFVLEEIPLPTPQIIGEAQFCPGTSTSLSAAQNYITYNWGNGATTPSITTEAAGELTLIVTDEWGCIGSTSLTLSEYETSVPDISAPAAFCPDTTAQLQAENGFVTYLWSTNATQPNITIDDPGLYQLSVTDANGCVTSDSVSIAHYTVTAPQIDGPGAFCEGDLVDLEATPGYTTYTWSTGANDAGITVADGGVFRVSVVDNNGCRSQASFQLIENSLPNVAIGGSASFCPGGFASLNAGGTYAEYLWSDGSTGPSIQVDEEGFYGLTVTDAQGCVNSASLEVSEQDELSPVISGLPAFCPGFSTTLNAGDGFTQYQWSDGSDAVSIEVSTPGTYSLTVEDASGCSGTATVEVEAYTLPVISIEGPDGFCEGEMATLEAQGSGITTFLWSDGSFDTELTVGEAGLYTLIGTDANGCWDTVSRNVEVFPLPEIMISGQDYFCQGSNTVLEVPAGYASYLWNNGEEAAAVEVAQAGTYAVSVTDSNACVGEAVLQVQGIPLPVADAGPNALLTCLVEAVELGGPSTSTGDEMAYAWQGPGIATDEMDEASPEATAPGEYILTVTDTVYGCVSMPDMAVVTADTSLPYVEVHANDTLDCVTSTVTLDGSASDSSPELDYTWYNEGLTQVGFGVSTLDVHESGIYILEVVNENSGCRQMDSALVAADYLLPGADAGLPQRLDCEQTSVGLEGTAAVAVDGLQYEWQNEAGSTVSNFDQATVTTPGWYYFQVLNPYNGCTSADSVEITQNVVYPEANAGDDQSIDCLNPTTTLDGSASSQGDLYAVQWAFENPDTVVAEGTYMHTASEPGLYYIIVANTDNHCISTASVEVVENNAAPTALPYEAFGPTCFGDSDGAILIDGVEGGTPPYLYSFDGMAFNEQLQYDGLGAGTYTITVQDMIGCEYSVEVVLEDGNDLWVDAGPDIEANIGEEVSLSAEVSIPEEAIASLLWEGLDSLSCAVCLASDLAPTATALYTITVVDENGCVASDQLRVFLRKDRNIYMPSAFSPNGDDNNDRFFIQGGAEVAKVNYFEVYSRWGEPVFFVGNAPANDPAYGWDGSFNGDRMNSGVFVWQAEVEFVDGEVKRFKGEVLLMR